MKLEKCFHCGLCKANCPVYKVLLRETVSPRGKSILMQNEMLSDVFYLCTLCKACDQKCPADVEVSEEIRNSRKELVEKGIETKANKEMIENIRKYGNPFGKIEKGKIPDKMYCC